MKPGILSRLLGRTETRSATSDSYAAAFGSRQTASGQHVNAALAENLATVTACIGAVASAMASLPAYVYRGGPSGRTELPNHPIAQLLRRPNAHQTWPDWMEWTIGQVLAHGNAVCSLEYDGAGRPTALVPIPWGNVQVYLLPSGRLAYDVVRYTAPWGGSGRPRRYLDGEVFHLRDRSDDGILGRSRISRAPEVLGNSLALQEWTGSMWRNGTNLSGVLTVPPGITKEGLDRLKTSFTEAYSGTAAARKVLFADVGSSFHAISVSPEDAEVLASRKFSVEELCRLFQVPPPIVQSYEFNSFTNAQQAALWFGQFSLAPWCRKIEAEFSRSVLTDPAVHLEIDLSGLMRGDYEARWKANVAAVQAGILDADEVREIEGWNPRPVKQAPPTPEAPTAA